MLSKRNQILIIANSKGYRVINGIIYNPKGKILNGTWSKDGYLKISIACGKEINSISVHRLVAYQKYGNKIFEDGIQVRHLDGDSRNNLEENIAIGTARDNSMDKKPETRLRASVNAAKHKRKFTDKEIKQIRLDNKNGISYNQLMKKYNISSKGTLSYIINHKYLSKV